MNEINPYATPKSWGQEQSPANCTREGKYVLVPAGSDLPQRCIKCNAPAITPIKKRKVYWHHPAWYGLILINILLYIFVGLIVRKKAEISPGLCQEHSALRKRNITLLIVASMTSLLAGIYLSTQGMEGVSMILYIVFILLLVIAVISKQLVVATRITKTTIKLKGCKEPFLASVENQNQSL